MIKKTIIFLFIICGIGTSFQLKANKAYVANMGNNTVSIFNTSTNTVTGIVTDLIPSTFQQPGYITAAPNGQIVYVSNRSANTVSIINANTDTVTGTITGFNNPGESDTTPDGTKMYVTNSNNNTVSIVDLTTNQVVGIVDDSDFPFTDNPEFISMLPDGTKAYVGGRTGNTVYVIDVAENKVIANLSGFDRPFSFAPSPDGSVVYVANNGNGNISIITVATNAVTSFNVDTSLNNLVMSPDGKKLYACSFVLSKVYVIDTDDNSVVATISTPQNSGFQAITPDGETLYESSGNSSPATQSVARINTVDNTVSGFVNDPDATFNLTEQIVIVPSQATSVLSGLQIENIFLNQTELVNVLSGQAPSGESPVNYLIYRDTLTNLIGTVSASGPLTFQDHDRSAGVTYTYYIVGIYQSGGKSATATITVKPV